MKKELYAGIGSPTEIRAELLDTSKDILGVLKRQDDLNGIRTRKAEQVLKLRKVMLEIKQLQKQADDLFPKENPESPKKKAPKKKSRKSKSSPEVDEIEAELHEIEERIKALEDNS